MAARVVRWYRDRPSYREDPRSHGEADERVAFSTALLWLDSLDAAKSVLERLLDEKVAVHLSRGDTAGVLIRLADVAVRQGNMAEARRLAGLLQTVMPLPTDSGTTVTKAGVSFYVNRAGMAAVLGDRDRAVELLGQGMQLQFATPLHGHIFFRSLFDYPPFQELWRPKG